MRDKNRIPIFLEKLGEVWNKYPDLRFGQLVVNCLGVDPFYVEDDIAKRKIEEFGNLKIKDISIDNMRIIEQTIPTKFICIEDDKINLSEFINTIEEILDTIPNSESFVLKEYEATSEDALKALEKMGYIEKKYGERQSVNYVIKNNQKKEELLKLYEKILIIIE